MPGSGGTHRDQHPQTFHAQCTTHEAGGPTGSHGNAVAAGAGYHQSLHAARLHLDQHHRRRHLHHRCNCLHRRCRCLPPTATTEAPTPATTPTSTATPSASSTASTAAPTVPSTTLAPLALAVAAPPTRSRRIPDLCANKVDSSSRSNRGEKGDRGTPLKERGTRVAARRTYS
ncbi:unnamed protein product [Closterium sp. NIES-53]